MSKWTYETVVNRDIWRGGVFDTKEEAIKEGNSETILEGGRNFKVGIIEEVYNFGIDVDKYIAVSFESFEKIIDILGGVEINVSEKEVSQINGVNNSGIQTLNGSQALAYSRIRYIDSAYERDNRQRTVIEALYNKFANGSSGNIMDIANEVLRYTKTNMAPLEIVSIANKAIKIKDTDFDQVEFPFEEARKDNNISEKGWVIEWDKDYNKDKLNKFIYDYANYKKSYNN